jgi:hypothetical protein
LERSQTKSEKEDSEKLVIGGKKKKAGKKPKEQVVDHFSIDIGAVSKFSFLKISPPLGTADLEPKVKELTDK